MQIFYKVCRNIFIASKQNKDRKYVQKNPDSRHNSSFRETFLVCVLHTVCVLQLQTESGTRYGEERKRLIKINNEHVK